MLAQVVQVLDALARGVPDSFGESVLNDQAFYGVGDVFRAGGENQKSVREVRQCSRG